LIPVLVAAVIVLGITHALTIILGHDERKRMLHAVLAKHGAEFVSIERAADKPSKPVPEPALDAPPRRPMGL